MKSIHNALLLVLLLAIYAQGQNIQGNHDATTPSPAVLRVKTMQTEIEKQQIEIDSLRLRLGKLQHAFEELAQMVADQSTDADDDDFTDDSDVSSWVVNGRANRSRLYAKRASRTKSSIWSSKVRSDHRSRAIPKQKAPLTPGLEY